MNYCSKTKIKLTADVLLLQTPQHIHHCTNAKWVFISASAIGARTYFYMSVIALRHMERKMSTQAKPLSCKL